jgi:hypothetical protein
MSYNGQFVVEISADDVTYTNYTSYVINATLRVGRQQLTDRYTPDVLNLELLAPLTSGPAIPPLGYYVRIYNFTGYTAGQYLYKGIISEVNRNYGMPYTSATGAAPADRISITALVRNMYFMGRAYNNARIITAGISAKTAVDTIVLDGCGLSVAATYVGIPGGGSAAFWDNWPMQGETYSGIVLDYVNTTLQGTVSRMKDQGKSTFQMIQGDQTQGNNFNFSDGTGSTTGWTATYGYDAIDFVASQDNSYTAVRMTYNTSSATTSSTGSAPFSTYQVTSNTQTLAKADSAADYTLAILGQSQYRPFSISTRAKIMTNPLLPEQLAVSSTIGTQVWIMFRGTTYYCILEGFTITQDLDDARYTFYFSPSVGQALILDSTAFGILNTNTLGIG